jgi:hypothetical protein
MKIIYETLEFEPESYEIFQEIVSRFGQADYDNEIKRKEHQDTLKLEWDALAYARNRQAEYPTIAELTVALYDTDDKSAVEAKRASVKLKYPKPS